MKYIDFCEDVAKLGDIELTDNERWISFFQFIKSRNRYTYEDISGLVGVPVRTLQNWCGGVREPPPYVLPLICFALASCDG